MGASFSPIRCRSDGACREVDRMAIKISLLRSRNAAMLPTGVVLWLATPSIKESQRASLITDLLITDYSPRLRLNRLAKPSGCQRPRRPIEIAHQFPNQTAPVILNR